MLCVTNARRTMLVALGTLGNATCLKIALLCRAWQVLASDPSDADLLLVPALSHMWGGRTAWHAGHAEHMTRVLTYVQRTYPQLWARAGGRDHVVWSTNDLGAVRWGAASPLLAAPIKVVHWGYAHNTHEVS